MPRLVEHGNVYSTCLALLDKRGWSIRIEPGPFEECDSLLDSYSATRDGTSIAADNPLELLGLAAIHEHHHPHTDESYWWWIDGRELKEELEGDALERGFWDYYDRDPEACEKEFRKANAASVDSEYSACEILGISEQSFRRFLELHPDVDS